MRIIGGKFKGKKLFTPGPKDDVRPTTDYAREALFNVLSNKFNFSDIKMLDVFCGTGAVGLEALSRGAKFVTFIDKSPAILQKNIKLFNFSNYNIICSDATKLGKSATLYNLVFMDAPYNKGLSIPTLTNLLKQGFINEDSIIVVELQKDEQINLPAEFNIEQERCYGLAKFVFLKLVNFNTLNQ